MERIPHKKGWRIITVAGKQWYWRYGMTMVVAKDEFNLTKKIGLNELTGIGWSEIERARHKGYFSVTPRQVARWLEGVE